MRSATTSAQIGICVCHTSSEMQPKTNMTTNTAPYHHSGTCGYLDIRRAWISGCSLMERLDCTQICLRKYRNVCMRVDVIDANERP